MCMSATRCALPDVYVCTAPRWYSGCITKKKAEDLLKDKLEGTFLIRVGNSPGTFCLSVKLVTSVLNVWRGPLLLLCACMCVCYWTVPCS